MSKTVQRSVAVRHPETEETHWFGPGDKLPGWAEKLVTNPRAFKPIDAEDEIQQPEEEDVFGDGGKKEVVYEDLTAAELELLCEERGLAKGGAKAEKIERLKMNDAATS
jgi:hypothetical protein